MEWWSPQGDRQTIPLYPTPGCGKDLRIRPVNSQIGSNKFILNVQTRSRCLLPPEHTRTQLPSSVLVKDPMSIIRKSRPLCAGGMETPNQHAPRSTIGFFFFSTLTLNSPRRLRYHLLSPFLPFKCNPFYFLLFRQSNHK